MCWDVLTCWDVWTSWPPGLAVRWTPSGPMAIGPYRESRLTSLRRGDGRRHRRAWPRRRVSNPRRLAGAGPDLPRGLVPGAPPDRAPELRARHRGRRRSGPGPRPRRPHLTGRRPHRLTADRLPDRPIRLRGRLPRGGGGLSRERGRHAPGASGPSLQRRARLRSALPHGAHRLRRIARGARLRADLRRGLADPRRRQRARRGDRRARANADPARGAERTPGTRGRRLGRIHWHGAARPVPDRCARVAVRRECGARRERRRVDGDRRRGGAAGAEASPALMAPSLERRVAIDAARAAGELLQAEFRAAHRVAFKGQTINLVTEMDERAEELIVGRLASAFPDDTILAEERGAAPGRSGRRWIVDPLDGTTNYAHGLPIFSVST